ncbi:hypothetical protein CDD83_4821 [Cordyceps sp. RAO-2017]|nr:hypothetical protein CDD83_4821 [Cordyceps sp. RAO-2017]
MGPPKPPVPHVAPIYRLTATALGAGMWFWIMYRAKKDGTQSLIFLVVLNPPSCPMLSPASCVRCLRRYPLTES